MKTALITDLHANREAVEAVLEHARFQGVDQYVLLGDFVGYGADPGWVVDTARALVRQGAVAVMGNGCPAQRFIISIASALLHSWRKVCVCGAQGNTLNVALRITPSVPSAPAIKRETS